MPGKHSRPLLRTTSKLGFPFGEVCDHNAVNAPVSSKHPFVPQHVMIGFDVPQETKSPDVCISPRSVLDVNVLPLEKLPQGRSFRSYVRALPLQNRGSQGVGLAIIVGIHAEEKGNFGASSPTGHNSASVCHQTHDHHPELNSMSVCLQSHHHHHHQQSQPIAIAANCHSEHGPATYKWSKYFESAGSEEDGSSSGGSDLDMEFFSSEFLSPQQKCVIHNRTSYNANDNEGCIARPSIFSVASVPSSHNSSAIQSMSFLDACALCQRAFVPGKDIFIYRGDQAFCSAECRGERIKIDEYKEKLMTLY